LIGPIHLLMLKPRLSVYQQKKKDHWTHTQNDWFKLRCRHQQAHTQENPCLSDSTTFATQETDASDSPPAVLAVAIAFAKVILVYLASTAFEFEICDPCRVLVVEYSVPKRSYKGL